MQSWVVISASPHFCLAKESYWLCISPTNTGMFMGLGAQVCGDAGVGGTDSSHPLSGSLKRMNTFEIRCMRKFEGVSLVADSCSQRLAFTWVPQFIFQCKCCQYHQGNRGNRICMKIPWIAAGRIQTEFHLEEKRSWETQLVLSIWLLSTMSAIERGLLRWPWTKPPYRDAVLDSICSWKTLPSLLLVLSL